MKLTIDIEPIHWNPRPHLIHGTNKDYRVVIVRFENQTFKWMPTYKQLAEISVKLVECEESNNKLKVKT